MTARRNLEWSDGAAGPVLAAGDDPVWQDSALCGQADPALFFPVNGYTGDAKAVCRRCPVQAPCLGYALDLEYDPRQDGVQGIWGALDADERVALRRALGLPGPLHPKADPVIPALKRCAGPCGQLLVLAEFHANAVARDGRQRWCRDCIAEHRADLRAEAAA